MTETSSGLKLLLEKIKPLPPTSEPLEPSWQQLNLLTKIENRRYKKAVLEELRQMLQLMEWDLWSTQHFKTCRMCQAELSLSLTRYNGRFCPWFLNIENDIEWPELYEEYEIYHDAPRLWDYDLGNYWTGENHVEALRFILDRCSWAEEKIKEMAVTATVHLEHMAEWDLNGVPPALDDLDPLDIYRYQLFWGEYWL